MTALGGFASAVRGLPYAPTALVDVTAGLIIANTGIVRDRPLDRWDEDNFRCVTQILQRLLALDDGPLAQQRPPGRRLSGGCHHASLLISAVLRRRGFPARVRAGYISNLHKEPFECHYVVEAWNPGLRRWLRVDPQVGCGRSRLTPLAFNLDDVPYGRFVTASEAWLDCRSRGPDPRSFVGSVDGWVLRRIAGDLVRDLAALNAVEMLPWDVWGAMPMTDRDLRESLPLFDRIANVSRSPDVTFSELRGLYESEDALRVPESVFNSRRGIYEAVQPSLQPAMS
jgi:hypothetical protein